jgi:hypothetical protein
LTTFRDVSKTPTLYAYFAPQKIPTSQQNKRESQREMALRGDVHNDIGKSANAQLKTVENSSGSIARFLIAGTLVSIMYILGTFLCFLLSSLT